MIKNAQHLLKVHDTNSARLIVSALEHALASVDPCVLVKRSVRLGDKLRVKDIHGQSKVMRISGDVYVVGAGKAVAKMADALCEVLGNTITAGAITVPYGARKWLSREFRSRISVTEAAHPVPDAAGIKGSRNITEVLSQAAAKDLVFVLLSGGGSALMPLPSQDLDLADKQAISTDLLRSGATIRQVNVVRKHLSAIKGGQLTRCARSAHMISLILSDVIGDDLSSIASGPTFPDTSTFAEALAILRKFQIGEGGSHAVAHLIKGVEGNFQETPKPNDPCFARVSNMIIGNNKVACSAAARYLRNRGIRTTYLGSHFEGEARLFGAFLARLASDQEMQGSRVASVLGGETTVTIRNGTGTGGRNLEAALACAISMKSRGAVCCIGTDGIDGNSDAAGAVVSRLESRANRSQRGRLQKYLDKHDSYTGLKALGSLILTGLTGTNVNDISIVCTAD